jgi:hypothetical protein
VATIELLKTTAPPHTNFTSKIRISRVSFAASLCGHSGALGVETFWLYLLKLGYHRTQKQNSPAIAAGLSVMVFLVS